MALLYVRTSSGGTGPAVSIDDLGITIATGAGWTLLSSSSASAAEASAGQFTAREIRDSRDLYLKITGGDLEWSKNGTSATSDTYVADYMLTQDLTDDFLDLTAGDFAFPAGAPASGVEGQTYWDSSTSGLYIWSDQSQDYELVASPGSVSTDHGNLIGLGDDDHPQYHDGSLPWTGNLNMGGFSISGVNLVDGRDVSVDGTNLDNHIADSSIHFTEGSIDHGSISGLGDDDHSQYLLLGGNEARNQVTGSIDMGPSTGYFILPQAADVATSFPAGSEGALAWDTDDEALYAHDGTQWFAIAPASGIVTDHGGLTGLLDDDHPQYGHLAQDESVSGLWTFDPTTATDPSIILPPVASVPTTNVVDGAIATVSGVFYVYDGTRSKFLSVDRKLLIASKQGFAKDIYLRVGEGIATSQTGIRALRDGTITGISLQTDSAATWTLEVRRNGTVTVLASLASGGAQGAQSVSLNADFSQGDELQFYANTAGSTIESPVGNIEIAWRI